MGTPRGCPPGSPAAAPPWPTSRPRPPPPRPARPVAASWCSIETIKQSIESIYQSINQIKIIQRACHPHHPKKVFVSMVDESSLALSLPDTSPPPQPPTTNSPGEPGNSRGCPPATAGPPHRRPHHRQGSPAGAAASRSGACGRAWGCPARPPPPGSRRPAPCGPPGCSRSAPCAPRPRRPWAAGCACVGFVFFWGGCGVMGYVRRGADPRRALSLPK